MAKNDDSAISLESILPAADRKSREWWDTLKPEQQKKFSSWLYMRYMSSVGGSFDMSAYYLISVNQKVNKHFNAVKNHPQLQYLLMTAASPGMGSVRHNWIPALKRSGSTVKTMRIWERLYPNANAIELDILAESNTEQDLREHLEQLGWTDKEIKAALKGEE
jgi:hypothetical protein